jgi:hypothetical protein
VLWAVREGRPDPKALSSKDKKDIEATIQDEVLHTSRYPEIRFASSEVSEAALKGSLELHGKRRAIEVPLIRQGPNLTCQIDLQQPDYGIIPYRAALGTLRVRPQVRVQLVVPAA